MFRTGGRSGGNFAVFLLVISSALLLRGAAATEYIVGDGFGWGVPPANESDFYEKWTANKTFLAGDSFVFNWSEGRNTTHTVSERTKEEYDSCNKTMGIDFVLHEGERLSFTLDKNGTYYYICTVGNHCEQGQKLKLVIGDGINDHNGSSAAASASAAGAFIVAALSALALSF